MRFLMPAVATGSMMGLTALLVGCDQSPSHRQSEPTWVDSAGVTIVHSPDPGEDPAAWRIDPEPSVVIGSEDGEEPYLFSEVTAAGILPDGRIFAADLITRSVRLFDQQGRFLEAWGRRGQGPGEFMLPLSAVHLYRGDSVAAVEMGGRRVSVFDQNGVFNRRIVPTYDYRPAPGMLPLHGCCHLIGVLPDGSWLAQYPEEVSTEGSGPRRGQVRAVRLSAEGEVTGEFGVFQGFVWREATGLPVAFLPIPLGPNLSITMSGARVLIGDGAENRVDEFDETGRFLRSFRVARDPLLFEAEARKAYEQSIRQSFSDASDDASVRFRLANLPEQLPAYESILADPHRNLWLMPVEVPRENSNGTRVALVLNADGVATAAVTLPSDTRILHVGAEAILGVQTDEMGVQRVVMHRILRAGT